MKNNAFFITLLSFVFLIMSQNAFAQASTQGTDFYVAFGRNLTSFGNTIVYQIRIVASQVADVTLTFKADSTLNDSIHLNAGEVYTYNLNTAQKAGVYSSSTATSNKSLRIQSTTPVSVYALNQTRGSADATNVFPVNTLGTEYYHFSYQPSSQPDSYLVIATENDTEVYEGATLRATLDAGQVYSYADAGTTDLTGRHITSNYPVAYFVATDQVLLPAGTTYLECLFQQMVPVNTWGKNFLVPVTHRGLERVRIIASQDNTQVTQTGGTIQLNLGAASLTLNAGQFVELEISLANGGCYITANKPVGVASYLVGASYSGLTVTKGDPALGWIPPIEQTISSTVIAPFVPTSAGNTVMDEHHALIVTAKATRSQTRLAIGTNPPTLLSGGTWTDGPANSNGSNYSFYSLQLTNDTSSYFFTNSNGLFVLGYGLGYVSGWGESYYYLAGASARLLSAALYVNGTPCQDNDNLIFCGSPQNISFEANLQNAQSSTPGYLKWYIDNTEEISERDNEQWSKTLSRGIYLIRMEVLDVEDQWHTISATITVSPCVIPVNPHLRSYFGN
ncbi:MAG: IgGFc-binding protein [Tannerellaceae bacterium]|nr:IgGFc-binding protein [Tannerellaceae bacterium]